MGDEITLNSQEVFLQLIQGQSRIEAKLDSQIQVAEGLGKRVCSLEQEVNQMAGERRFMKFWLPLVCTVISIVVNLIPYVKVGK